MEHLLGRRPTEALADVKNVGDQKNREDRRLGPNEREHSHAPPRRKSPGRLNCGYRDRHATHQRASEVSTPIRNRAKSESLIRTSSPGPRDASGPTAAAGS